MLIVYLALLVTVAYWVIKLIGPELAKPPLIKAIPVVADNDATDNRVEKLEIQLAEKNKIIQHLQIDIRILRSQSHNFDKFKTILEGEIQHLREQNRIFRSELGLPTVQKKENSIT